MLSRVPAAVLIFLYVYMVCQSLQRAFSHIISLDLILTVSLGGKEHQPPNSPCAGEEVEGRHDEHPTKITESRCAPGPSSSRTGTEGKPLGKGASHHPVLQHSPGDLHGAETYARAKVTKSRWVCSSSPSCTWRKQSRGG